MCSSAFDHIKIEVAPLEENGHHRIWPGFGHVWIARACFGCINVDPNRVGQLGRAPTSLVTVLAELGVSRPVDVTDGPKRSVTHTRIPTNMGNTASSWPMLALGSCCVLARSASVSAYLDELNVAGRRTMQ